MKNMYDKICRQCGVSYKGGPRAWFCPSCRAIRKKEASRNFDKKGKPDRAIGSIDKCTVCGKDYTVEGPRQKYCKDCAPKQVKIVDRKQSLEYYRKNKDYINQKRNARRRVYRWHDNMTGAVMHQASGVVGVSWHKYHELWHAYIWVNGKFYGLGYFKNKASAVRTRKKAEDAKKNNVFDTFIKRNDYLRKARKYNNKSRKYRQEYYNNNREKHKLYMKEYHQNNMDAVDERRRIWMKDNPDKARDIIRRSHKNYYDSHREEILEKKKPYTKARYAMQKAMKEAQNEQNPSS